MGYLRFLLTHPRFLSFGFGLNVFVALGQTFYVSLYNGEIRAAFSLSHGELAALYGSATIVGSVLLLVTGRLLDRVDLRWFTAVTTILVAIGCWLFSVTTTVTGLFVAIFAVRFAAQGLWGTCAQVSMARYFDEDRGKAAGVAGTGYALGYAIFPLIGAWLLTSFGWRDAWSLSGWFVLLIILPLIMVQLWGHGTRHRAYEAKLISLSGDTAKNPVQQWTLSDVLSDARFWLLQPSMVVVPCVVFSIQFHQLFLVETKGWNLTAFAGSYSLYAAVSLFATLTCGSLIDRYKSHRLIRFCVLPLVPALVALAVFDSPLIIPVVMALTGMTFGLSLVVYVTIWAELYGTKHMGAIRSFNIFFNVTIASGVMVLTGWLIDQGTTIAMMAIGGVVFVAISLICLEIAGRLPNRRLQGAP
ncbi:MAG: MFS transporter [Rhodospirillaceae bacterium]|jgi:sugar phosphate permease|nr:MFS transporter [Rhodospirillaceae bacterium]MBT5240933.1 MFS transporter [Rhodospirillaceae bacterium]MBT5564549.1 MFS transporter [Rhodospirillaceae bacterium]MBT6090884.1 MFS transporter [Rhodospirillaceae bacterium]